jgi:hypothetical protein
VPRGRRRNEPPVGTTFSFSLDQAATVRLRFTRWLPGRRVGGKCAAQTIHNHSKPLCARFLLAGTLTKSGHAGRNRVKFDGRLPGRGPLTPGAYTLTITAANAEGQASAPALQFTIASP